MLILSVGLFGRSLINAQANCVVMKIRMIPKQKKWLFIVFWISIFRPFNCLILHSRSGDYSWNTRKHALKGCGKVAGGSARADFFRCFLSSRTKSCYFDNSLSL